MAQTPRCSVLNFDLKLLILGIAVLTSSSLPVTAFHLHSSKPPEESVSTGFSVVAKYEDLKTLPGNSMAAETSPTKAVSSNQPTVDVSNQSTANSLSRTTGDLSNQSTPDSSTTPSSDSSSRQSTGFSNQRIIDFSSRPTAASSSRQAGGSSPKTGTPSSQQTKQQAGVSTPRQALKSSNELTVPMLQSLARYPNEIPNLRMVSGRLLRGGQPTDAGLNLLKSSGVKTIIDLRAEEPKIAEVERKTVESLGMKFVYIPMYAFDSPNNKQFHQFLSEVSMPENGPVYVHCLHGRDRTGTMTGAYRIMIENWTFDNAFKEMMACGYRPGFANMTRSLHDLAVAKGDKSALPTASFVAADLKSRFQNFAKRNAPGKEF